MADFDVLIFAALIVFLFGLVSRKSAQFNLSGAMVFALIGVLVGPEGLAWFDLHVKAETVQLLAEVTLMLILFVDASLIDLSVLRRSPSLLPARLLGIGLPLTMVAGFMVGVWLFPDLPVWAVALMALILSPTDAALGQAIVKSELVPESIRQSINIESGLNDGIALPPILVCLAALGAETSSGHVDSWGWFMLGQLTLGPLIGVAIGWLGAQLLRQAHTRGWMEETFQRLVALSLALVSYASAEALGGNGFIATFCAGLALGAQRLPMLHSIQAAGEAEGTLLSLGVFLIFGLAMVTTTLPYWGWLELLYAVLSLTLIRMIPVAIALVGARMAWPTVLFVGWSGPRGIASVLYLLLAVAALGTQGYEQVLAVIVLTVSLSIVLHGLSAAPLCRWYGTRFGQR